ncbi:hypothetical protein RIF29_04752 [Crotalaria pallida]|uniref:RING-type E3 ubiquitin transferase n=1 Tax=Crotalaria pallida TaxID=3830 RepID=A0AAN9P9E4_CROPI
MDNNNSSSSNESTNKFNEIFDPRSYSIRGKIMLSSISILFFVVILMLILHLYARWYLISTRRQNRLTFLRHLQRSGNNLVFYMDAENPTADLSNADHRRGLDASIIAMLPVFAYDPKSSKERDCAVCLSEFQEGESGRLLPRCNHAFHTDCIDMWFHSHATCPLCRAPVEMEIKADKSSKDIVIGVCEPGTGSGSERDENRTGSEVSSSSKPSLVSHVTVEIPERGEGVQDESGLVGDSPSTSSFRSPMTRVLSLLGRERRGSVSPSSCGGSAAEGNAERGGHDETQ